MVNKTFSIIILISAMWLKCFNLKGNSATFTTVTMGYEVLWVVTGILREHYPRRCTERSGVSEGAGEGRVATASLTTNANTSLNCGHVDTTTQHRDNQEKNGKASGNSSFNTMLKGTTDGRTD